nr:unnamed protein product [Digitaria exilis]
MCCSRTSKAGGRQVRTRPGGPGERRILPAHLLNRDAGGLNEGGEEGNGVFADVHKGHLLPGAIDEGPHDMPARQGRRRTGGETYTRGSASPASPPQSQHSCASTAKSLDLFVAGGAQAAVLSVLSGLIPPSLGALYRLVTTVQVRGAAVECVEGGEHIRWPRHGTSLQLLPWWHPRRLAHAEARQGGSNQQQGEAVFWSPYSTAGVVAAAAAGGTTFEWRKTMFLEMLGKEGQRRQESHAG